MYDLLKNIVNETISLQFSHVAEFETEELEATDYKKYSEEADKIFNEIRSKVDKDTLRLISKLIDAKDYEMLSYGNYYFKKGVQAGLTDLKYLEKMGQGIVSL